MFCRIYKVAEWKSWALTIYNEDGTPTYRESEYFPRKRDAMKRAKELMELEGIEYRID